MKEQKKKILYIIIAVIVIIGAVMWKVKGFNMETDYSSREQIVLTNNTELDTSKIEEIAKTVLNKKVEVRKVDRFGNSVQIITSEITEEEKTNIVNKVNEECSLEISNDDVKIIKIANTRVKDVLKPYILPAVAVFSSVLLYFVIIYNKLGLKKVLVKAISLPVIVELVYYSVIAITRIPFGRIVNSIAVGLYVVSIVCVTMCFQKEILAYKKEND